MCAGKPTIIWHGMSIALFSLYSSAATKTIISQAVALAPSAPVPLALTSTTNPS